ncbi:MAG: D-2-hydroxyacid dehydrogenase [Pseudomonadota bacterium]
MDVFLFSSAFDHTQIERVRSVIGDDTLHVHDQFEETDNLGPAFMTSQVVFGNIPASWVPRSPSLEWLQLCSVGISEYCELDWPALEDRITLTNLPDFFTEPVAESILAGILALYRGVNRLAVLRENSDWQGDAIRAQLATLRGAAVVLFGYGDINRRLEELLAPFQCNVTRFGSEWTPAQLDKALAAADVVVSTVPETDGTIGVFNEARLALLKNDALFVNFGRGSVVDEAALAAALHRQAIGGAVIDVTQEEPLPKTHPFWTAPNMIVTQHSGGGTVDEMDQIIDVFADNLARYRRGEPLLGIVDFEKGY